MMILGVSTLGNLNTKAMTQEAIGMTFWQIIISAGILAMVVSVLNVVSVSSKTRTQFLIYISQRHC